MRVTNVLFATIFLWRALLICHRFKNKKYKKKRIIKIKEEEGEDRSLLTR